jgi:hypothetical protein
LDKGNYSREVNGILEALKFFDLPQGIIVTANQSDQITIEDKLIRVVPATEFFI